MKKIMSVLLAVALVLCLAACGGDAPDAEDIPNASLAEADDATENNAGTTDNSGMPSFEVVVTPGSYSYEMYGRIAQLEVLENGIGVIAIEPLSRGGEDYEGYPWSTCYISCKITEQLIQTESQWRTTIHEDHDDVAFRFIVRNDDNGGLFVHLPSIVESLERISAADIPTWGGA